MSRNIYVLDDNHKAFFLYTGDRNVFGLLMQHKCIDGYVEDLLPFRDDGYSLVEDDPISLDRYVLCHDCGDYGSIIDGEWVLYV